MSTRKGKRKKPKRRPIKPDDPAQSGHFITVAKELGLDKKDDAFDKVMKKLLKPKRGGS